ncbi:acyl carrier protein [Enterocloster bolteae]|jgi:acyl carrier protein|uniref:Acyl carrier protein n=1 Tax=Enterocloster bolteae TaxID=208479 RepID=A0A414AYD4_9FIRM|nr:acyl carrier protein [Enterocloster bolteae]
MRDNVFEKVADILRDVLDVPELPVTEDMTMEDVEDWDSVAQMTIMSALESEFKIELSLDKIVAMTSVRSIVDAVMNMKE